MQAVSGDFERIFDDITHVTRARVLIGVEPFDVYDIDDIDVYNIENLYELKLSGNVLPNNTPGVGGANAKQLTFSILPKSVIPRGEKLTLEVAVENESEISEWISEGVFFVDTRETSADGLHTTFHCYDSMLKADVPFMENTSITSWTQQTTDRDVVSDIANIMGVAVSLSTISTLGGYTVQRPLDDYTAREVLSFIGAMNGGNWIITGNDGLKLIKYVPDRALLSSETHIKVKFGDTFIVLHTPDGGVTGEESNVYRNVETFTDLGKTSPYTGVKAWTDDENFLLSGTETGSVLEFDCPWATLAVTGAILDEIKGYVYHAFEATKAELTPAAELGDVVGVNDIYAPLYSFEVTIDGSYLPTIGAPSNGELDYEYPYHSAEERAAKRQSQAAITIARQIADGTYTGGTFINGTTIYAPNIYGGATLHIGTNSQATEGYNFNVDQYGNVTSHGNASYDGNLSLGGNISMGGSMNVGGSITLAAGGNINLTNGSITWGANNSPVIAMYSADGIIPSGQTPDTASNWHSTLALTDYFASYSYDGGTTWTDAVRIRGTNGSDASVTFANVNNALESIFRAYAAGETTGIYDYYIYSPEIRGGKILGAQFYAGIGQGFFTMSGDSLSMYDPVGNEKASISYNANVPSGAEDNPSLWSYYPYLSLGIGSGSDSSGAGLVMKFGRGVWIGDSSVRILSGNYPGASSIFGDSIRDISNILPNATGIFVDLYGDTVYQYISGVPTPLRRINYGTTLPATGREGDIFILLDS